MSDSAVNMDTTVVASDRLMASEVDGELVMLDLEQGTYFGLDAVGAAVWAAMASPVTVAHVCDRMLEQFEGDPPTVRAEVLAFVTDLHSQGLVHLP